MGVLYNPNRYFSAQIYVGVPFKDFDDSDEEDLQDWGIHFNIAWFAF